MKTVRCNNLLLDCELRDNICYSVDDSCVIVHNGENVNGQLNLGLVMLNNSHLLLQSTITYKMNKSAGHLRI